MHSINPSASSARANKQARSAKLPKLPNLLQRKLYKTGQTRGADDDVIYQNRVLRNSTVLIPYRSWKQCRTPSEPEASYENDFIVLISAQDYFSDSNVTAKLADEGLAVGANTLVFYETRSQWLNHNPEQLGWIPASQRSNPLGGQYVARIAGTTAAGKGMRINRGFTLTAMKGAGIRVYEYASSVTIERCRQQLESLFWLCADSEHVAESNGMSRADVVTRKTRVLNDCQSAGLLDTNRLIASRVLNRDRETICPLCRLELSSQGFFERMAQAEGRAVHDLTITELNLFHIEELRVGVTNHRPYNLGWGHHHCNVVVRDSGIAETLRWMRQVIERNGINGYS